MPHAAESKVDIRQREARVAHLRKQATRRMMNQALSAGWDAWHELWSAKTYAMSALREVANRLSK